MKPDIPSIKDRILHITEAVENISQFTRNHNDYEEFSTDKMAISACLYQFTIISEASTYIPGEILTRYPYPWNKIKAFRNLILHHYDGVDSRLVWDTIRDVLPEFKQVVETILRNEF